MNKKIIVIFILCFVVSPIFAAKNTDLSELEKYKDKYKELAGKKGKSASSKIDEITVEPPKSRFIDTSPKTTSPEDKRHVLVHMKLANRHFSKKNYEKAIEEVNSVFERDPANSGGHFMSAVIAGRKKDYKTAWYHISIAKEKDSGNTKIDDFINKLKTVSSKPDYPEWISGIYNGIQTDASDRTFDLLEKLLLDECTQNITKIETTDYTNESDNCSLEVTFKARDQFDSDKIVSVLKRDNPTGVNVVESSNKNLKVKLTYKQIKSVKTDAKPISNINDFINDLMEALPEVAISNNDEGEPNDGVQEIIYEISSREFSSLNQFIRKLSPYATKYILQSMELAYIPGSQSTIWKAKIKVLLKV